MKELFEGSQYRGSGGKNTDLELDPYLGVNLNFVLLFPYLYIGREIL